MPPSGPDPQESLAEAAQRAAREEVFPRQRTADLLAEAEADERRRGRWQVVTAAIGLALLALGLPVVVPWGSGEMTRAIAGERTPDMLAWLGRALMLVPGIDADRAAYALAAFFLATSLLCFYRLLRDFGFEHYVALGAALTTAASPILFFAGSAALSFSAGTMGACAVARSLVRTERGRGTTPLWIPYTVAWLLWPGNAWLVIPVWEFARRETTDSFWKSRSGAPLVLSSGLAFLTVLGSSGFGSTGARVGGIGGLSAFGIGVGFVAIATLWAAHRIEEESPPPAWLTWWSGAAVFASLGPGPPTGAPWYPLAAIALADFVARRERIETARRIGTALLVAQLALTSGFRIWWSDHLENEQPWLERARAEFSPGDLVVVWDEHPAFLLHHRYGLEAVRIDLDGTVLTHQSASGEPEGLEAAVRRVREAGGVAWWLPRASSPPHPPAGLDALELRPLSPIER